MIKIIENINRKNKILYTIFSERMELKTYVDEEWSEEDILDVYDYESSHDRYIKFESESKNEAEKEFERLKQFNYSYVIQGNMGYLLLTDVFTFDKVTYDEDGDFLEAEAIDIFASPYIVEDDDE